jgi:hypothetical protein
MRRPKLANRLRDVRDEVASLLDGTVTGDVGALDVALRIESLLGGMHRHQREYPTFVLTVEELDAVNRIRRGWKISGPEATAEIMQAAAALRHVGI